MRRFAFWLPALLGLLVLTEPAAALPQPKLPPEATDKPAVIVHVRPINDLLEDAGYIAKMIGQGDIFDAVKPGLGPALEAIDGSKPIGFYARISPELVDSVGILMLPIKSQKDLLANLNQVGVNPTEQDGLYTVNVPAFPFSVLFRFHKDYAYATVRNSPKAEADMQKNKLYSPEMIFAGKDDSLISVTVNLDAIPTKLKQKGLDGLDEGLRKLHDKMLTEKNPVVQRIVESAAEEVGLKVQSLIVDAVTYTARFEFDRKKEKMAFSSRLVARKGSPLATDIAGVTGGNGLGAGLASSNFAAQGATFFSLPASMKKTFEPLVDQLLDEAVKSAKKDQEMVKELLDTLKPTIKAGLLDAGFDLRPNSAGGYVSLLAGVRVKDGDRIEATLRKIVSGLPEGAKKDLTIDAEKVSGVAIHRGPAKLDRKAEEVFGPDVRTYFAFRKDMVLFSIGAEAPALAAIKDGINASPKMSKTGQGQASIRNIAKLFEPKHEGITEAAKKAFPDGSDDLIRYSETGGEAFESRVSASTRVILFGVLAAELRRGR
jgi:hypothetical protein